MRAAKDSSSTHTVCRPPSSVAGSTRVALSVRKRAPKRSAWSRIVCMSCGPMIPSVKPG